MESTNENKLYQVAEIQLTYKSNVKPSQRPRISGSRDAFTILKANWDEGTIEFVEQFKAMFTIPIVRAQSIDTQCYHKK